MALCDFDGNDDGRVEDDGHGSAGKSRSSSVRANPADGRRWNRNLLAGCRRIFERIIGNRSRPRSWIRSSVEQYSQNPGRLRPGRDWNDGTCHAKDVDCPQQRENGLVRLFVDGQSSGRQLKFVVRLGPRAVVQRKTKKRLAGRPSNSGKCRLFVAVVGQSDGRRSRPSNIISPSCRRAGLVGRRAFRLPSGPGRLILPPARHRCPGSTGSRRFIVPRELTFSYPARLFAFHIPIFFFCPSLYFPFKLSIYLPVGGGVLSFVELQSNCIAHAKKIRVCTI